jgi:hypothetical protein
MKKATRLMLKYLEPTNPNACCVNVAPMQYEKAKLNQCFDNVMKFLRENDDWQLCSGWLVGDYWQEHGTAVIPHYWVRDCENGMFFDLTPNEDTQQFEYILDSEIADNIDTENKNAIPVSIKIYSDGKVSAYLGNGRYLALSEIYHKSLFALAE